MTSSRKGRARIVGPARLLAAAACLVLSACGQHATVPDRPPSALRMPAAVAADHAWTYTGPDAGAYSDIDPSQPPSLYDTAWMVRVAKQEHIAVPRLDTSSCLAWLRSILASPEPKRDSLSRVQTVALTVQALTDLGGRADAMRVAADLRGLRAHGMFRGDTGAPASWGATATATRT